MHLHENYKKKAHFSAAVVLNRSSKLQDISNTLISAMWGQLISAFLGAISLELERSRREEQRQKNEEQRQLEEEQSEPLLYSGAQESSPTEGRRLVDEEVR